MKYASDRKIVSSARNLVAEYGPLLALLSDELIAEEDAVVVPLQIGMREFDIALVTIKKESRKQAFRDFINRIKSYGNQKPE